MLPADNLDLLVLCFAFGLLRTASLVNISKQLTNNTWRRACSGLPTSCNLGDKVCPGPVPAAMRFGSFEGENKVPGLGLDQGSAPTPGQGSQSREPVIGGGPTLHENPKGGQGSRLRHLALSKA